MVAPILTTKLHFPAARAAVVPRLRLLARLDEGLSRPLTVISAPAGYGKTTLLSEWRTKTGRNFPAAWLSLDEHDNDARTFLSYLVFAMESAGTGLAGRTLLLLQSASPPALDLIWASLVEDLTGYPHDLAIILDDYHAIESAAVHEALRFLLEHFPSHIHLVLLTRVDPPLPLARLRARGQVTEIRTADLRFSSEEAADFLNQVMGLQLAPEDVAALEARTEGWIAGLQLAALSMHGREDIQHFISAFTGSHRYIVDYLVEEVLNRQPGHIHDFLLKTSILERITASLCDTLLENNAPGDSQAILEYLERANIFLTPLDDERRWYRYHHLFADVLRSRLAHSQPEALPVLYRRAIHWYEHNDLVDQAIQHALRLKDYAYAEELLQRHWLHLLLKGFMRETLIGWVESLPETLLEANPRLCMVQAWMLLSAGRVPEAMKATAYVEEAIRLPSDDPDRASLPAEVLSVYAFEAMIKGDFARSLALSQQAQALVPASAVFARGAIAITLEILHFRCGNFDEAIEAARLGWAMVRAGGAPAGRVSAISGIVKGYKLQGKLQQAMDTAREAIQAAEAEHQDRFPYYGAIYRLMAAIHYEWNQLAQAERILNLASQMAGQSHMPDEILATQLSLLQLRYAQGNLPAALELLNSLAPLFQSAPALLDDPETASEYARWQLVLGRAGEAQAWLERASLAVPDRLVVTSGVLLNAARMMLGLNQCSQALALLQKIERAAANSIYWQIESLVLQASAWQKTGDQARAQSCLNTALGLAEEGGFVRIFIDQGPAMAEMLRQAAARGSHPRYAARLLEAAPAKETRPAAAPAPLALIEPLSEREKEVLRLIARGRLNKEIADDLVIALGTVKRHTSNIFRKLDVFNRTQAVARSRELGLI